jgi:hypothetical protein
MASLVSGISVSNGTVVTPAILNANPTLTAGTIVDADISSSAAIAPGKLSGAVGVNSWITATSTTTAIAGDRIACNTTAGAFSVALPASPSTGAMVTIADSGRTWSVNNLTVSRNGLTIEELSEDLLCDKSGTLIVLFYTGSTWRILH